MECVSTRPRRNIEPALRAIMLWRFGAAFSSAQLQSMASARSVECQVGPAEFKFSSTALRELREMAEKIRVVESVKAPTPVPFDETKRGRTLRQEFDAAYTAQRHAKDEAMQRVQQTEGYSVRAAELDELDRQRKSATGQAKLDAGKRWRDAKDKLDRWLDAAVAQDPAYAAAAKRANAAHATYTAARDEYDKSPTTRPT